MRTKSLFIQLLIGFIFYVGISASAENPFAISISGCCDEQTTARKHYCHLRGSLKNSYLRFKQDKEGCVAFLGGSITEMSGWRNMIQDWLTKRFPDTNFRFIDAGIASTGTTPHAFRLENDVLSKGDVDLLFVEGAVNDHTNGFSAAEQIRGMEGIVRHALTAHPYMDIVMLHFVYKPFLEMYGRGQTPDVILNHERVANHYLIPSINCAKEIFERIEDKEFTWKDFGGTHPNKFGHSFYAAAIRYLLDAMWDLPVEAARQEHEIPQALLDNDSYVRGKFADLEEARLGSGWSLLPDWFPRKNVNTRSGFVHVPMLYSDTPGASFTYSFKGRSVGLFMACGPSSGIVEYSIDGGGFQRVDTFTRWSGKIYLPWLYVLATGLDPHMTHNLIVRLSDSAGKELVIRNIVIDE